MSETKVSCQIIQNISKVRREDVFVNELGLGEHLRAAAVE